MDARIAPKPLSGTIRAIASKSIAHRMLICAALAKGTTRIDCPTSSVDIEATASCLASLGCNVEHPEGAFIVTPPTEGFSRDAVLDCHESGSTLRFMLPVVSALGCGASFIGEGRLASRPLSPLYEELLAHGMSLSEQGTFPLTVEGELAPGRFELPGNVSSQFISGLLMAAPALGGGLEVLVREPIESRPYIDLTISALAGFGVHVERTALDGAMLFRVAEGSACTSEGIVRVEGDWSNAAFWLCAGALGTEPIEVLGLDPESPQGDRAVIDALREFGADVACTGNSVTVTPGSLHAVDIDAHDFPEE
ncbi:MAG: 3-phosphoshikimate 1-carboxyvinyltransferase, partial [Atopobiaceae bacterium]|nr:3-phosphoshikimate 1-carboxyvinyltransferase [Atopobiaceae bacterium]